MQYELSIRQDNLPAYIEIQREIKEKSDGLFTLILRVNNGKIVDTNVVEFTDVKRKYFRLKELFREEFVILHYLDGGTKEPAVRSDDDQLSA